MSRRVSQRSRVKFSEILDASDVAEKDVLCDQKIRRGQEPRKLIYRRLACMENTFDGKWPEKTNICCWYCRLPFDTTPIPVVQQYDPVTGVYDVYGITCSPGCSKAYISSLRNNDGRTRLMWQSKMLVEVFGLPADKPIRTADAWEAIDVFGGYLTIEEWRKQTPGVTIRLKKPPFVPFHVYTETELKGLCTIEQIEKDCALADAADTLEQQAVQHGAAFSLKGLRRPEESKVIRTVEQLQEAHPRYEAKGTESVFQEFLDTQQLPSAQECQEIRNIREAERKAKRKRKKTASSQKTREAASRGKTLFLDGEEAGKKDEPTQERSKRSVQRVRIQKEDQPEPPTRRKRAKKAGTLMDFLS